MPSPRHVTKFTPTTPADGERPGLAPMVVSDQFEWLSDATHCCRTNNSIGKFPGSVAECARRCAQSARCSYWSHTEDFDGACWLCDGCRPETNVLSDMRPPGHGMYSSWRRLTAEASTERLVEPANERMLAEAIARASSSKCRYDESPSFKCEYKTEPNARLTAGGGERERIKLACEGGVTAGDRPLPNCIRATSQS